MKCYQLTSSVVIEAENHSDAISQVMKLSAISLDIDSIEENQNAFL